MAAACTRRRSARQLKGSTSSAAGLIWPGLTPVWSEPKTLRRRLSDHGGIVLLAPRPEGMRDRTCFCPQGQVRRSSLTGATCRGGVTASVPRGATASRRTCSSSPPSRFLNKGFLQRASRTAGFSSCGKGEVNSGFACPGADGGGNGSCRTCATGSRRACSAATPARAGDVERYLIGRGAADADKVARVRHRADPFCRASPCGYENSSACRLCTSVLSSPCRRSRMGVRPGLLDGCRDGAVTAEMKAHRTMARSLLSGFEHRGRGWRSVTPLALHTARAVASQGLRASPRQKGRGQPGCERKPASPAPYGWRCATQGSSPRLRRSASSASRSTCRAERAEFFAAGTRFSWRRDVARPDSIRRAGSRSASAGGRSLSRPRADADGRGGSGCSGLPHCGRARRKPPDPLVVARAARRAMMARAQGFHTAGPGAAALCERTRRRWRRVRAAGLTAISPSSPTCRAGGCSTSRRAGSIAGSPVGGSFAWTTGWWSVRWRTCGRCALAKAGRLILAPMLVDAETDPLFAAARHWESVTEYRVARHRRRLADEEALRADVAAELQRIGWPNGRDCPCTGAAAREARRAFGALAALVRGRPVWPARDRQHRAQGWRSVRQLPMTNGDIAPCDARRTAISVHDRRKPSNRALR